MLGALFPSDIRIKFKVQRQRGAVHCDVKLAFLTMSTDERA